LLLVQNGTGASDPGADQLGTLSADMDGARRVIWGSPDRQLSTQVH
jgi:hypothetical protein